MIYAAPITIVSTSLSSQILHTNWIYVFCDHFAAVGSQTEARFILFVPATKSQPMQVTETTVFSLKPYETYETCAMIFPICCDNKRKARTPQIRWMTPEHLTSIGAFLFYSPVFWLWLLWTRCTNTWHQHVGLPGSHNHIHFSLDGISLNVKNNNVFVSQYLCRPDCLVTQETIKCSPHKFGGRHWFLPVKALNFHNKWLIGCCTTKTKHHPHLTTTKT